MADPVQTRQLLVSYELPCLCVFALLRLQAGYGSVVEPGAGDDPALGQLPHPGPYRAVCVLYAGRCLDRKSTRLNSSHYQQSRMPSSA